MNEKTYKIGGIQVVVSIFQVHGFERLLMQAMINYANKNNFVLIGFCEPRNREFYRKFGLKVSEDKESSFFHFNEDNSKFTEEVDVIYDSQSKNEIEDALNNNAKFKHFVQHW